MSEKSISYEIPTLCVKCGTKHYLVSRDYTFWYQTFWGYLGLLVGLTYDLGHRMEVFFCQECSDVLDIASSKSKQIFYLSIGMAVVVMLFGLPTTGDAPLAFLMVIVCLLLPLAGFLARVVIISKAQPKVLKINRSLLIVEIPGYGAINFLSSNKKISATIR